MNLILFEVDEIARPLPKTDPRAVHLLTILRRKSGESFDVGQVNGPRGKASVAAEDADTLTLTFTWGAVPPPLDVITLIVGMPRPQTARDILRDATSLGVNAIHFVRTERSEPSYASSTLWTSGEWRRHLLTGAAQAFDTRLPEVRFAQTLAEAAAAVAADAVRLALDNYEGTQPLSLAAGAKDSAVVLAIGSERGWTQAERALLREHRFGLVHLGARVLRTETAVTAALAVIKADRGTF